MSSKQQTRRGFLKTSVAAASAAALAELAVARSAHAAGDDTIRIGVVGCGGRGSGAARDALEADPGVRLVAMADLFADRVRDKLKSLQQQRPNQVAVDDAHCFVGLDGYRRVIESADVVLIACAAKFHPMYLKAAIEAGKHVFVEKPHAIDPSGIRQVMEACELAKQKKLSVLSGLQSRFDPAIQETINRVLDGAIGDIVAIEENFLRPPYGTLFRAPGLTEIQYQYSNQYRFSWLCGDDVPQSLVHNLDRVTWALREQTPLNCHGLAGRSSCFDRPFIYGDVFDHHSVIYHYANGVRVYALCRTQPGCYNENSSIIMGTKGVAYPLSGRIDGQTKWKHQGTNQSPYRLEHERFFKAIRSGNPLNCGDYMARSTMVAILGQLSCYSGREVTWDQAMKSDFCLGPKPEQCTWDMEPPVKPDANGIYPVAIPGVTKNV
jgi:predicted dehydrogenase